MRFQKAVVHISLLLVCFMLAGLSAKAETVIFTDLSNDNITVTGTAISRVTIVPGTCGTAVTTLVELCKITLAAPTGYILKSPTIPSIYLIGEGSTTAGTAVSDALITGTIGIPLAAPIPFEFDSDLSSLENHAIASCPLGGCDVSETGGQQTALTITWNKIGFPNITVTDSIIFQSDAPEVPEPPTLILFGSGLAIAGGFIRRRRRVVTPSIPA
jgi:hypothetical protein